MLLVLYVHLDNTNKGGVALHLGKYPISSFKFAYIVIIYNIAI
jgi:hypothetical protein